MSDESDQVLALPIQFPVDWERAPVRDVVEFVADGDWVESKDQGGSDFRLLQISNIGTGSFVETGNFRYVTAETFDRLRCTEILPGDVLVARMPEPTGRAWFVSRLEGRCITAVDVAIVRPLRSLVDGRYLSYFFNTPINLNRVDGLATGTTRRRVRRADLARLEIPLPPLVEQRAIAGVLGALDDKIESNRRLVVLLERIGRTELASRLEGDNGEAWESAWPETSLGEVLSLIETGDRPKGGVSQIEDGVPSIGAESIIAPGVFDYSKTKFVPREYFEKMKRGVLHSGDVLLYKDGGTPGNFIPKVSMYQEGFPFPVAAINSHVYRLRVKEPYSQAFLYFWLSSQRMLDEMWLRGTGAAIPSLNSTNVKGLPFPVVPLDRLHPVLDVLDQYFSRLHRAAREARTLELLRNALMPELLSGRLRVRDAEIIVEGAV